MPKTPKSNEDTSYAEVGTVLGDNTTQRKKKIVPREKGLEYFKKSFSVEDGRFCCRLCGWSSNRRDRSFRHIRHKHGLPKVLASAQDLDSKKSKLSSSKISADSTSKKTSFEPKSLLAKYRAKYLKSFPDGSVSKLPSAAERKYLANQVMNGNDGFACKKCLLTFKLRYKAFKPHQNGTRSCLRKLFWPPR